MLWPCPAQIKCRGMPRIWYSIAEANNTPRHLFSCLSLGMMAFGPPHGQEDALLIARFVLCFNLLLSRLPAISPVEHVADIITERLLLLLSTKDKAIPSVNCSSHNRPS